METEEKLKDKFYKHIVNLYTRGVKNRKIIEESGYWKQMFFVLQQIRDTAAMFEWKEIYKTTTFLTKKIKRNAFIFSLEKQEHLLFFDALRIVMTQLMYKGYEGSIQQTNIEKKKLLLVGFDFIITEWLRGQLRQLEEYEVVICTYEKVIETIMAASFDLLLMHVQENVPEGLNVIRQLRSNQLYDLLPILCFTHHTAVSYHQKVYEAGGDDLFLLPFSFPMLQIKMESRLKQRKRHIEMMAKQNIFFHDVVAQQYNMKQKIEEEWSRFSRNAAMGFSLLYIQFEGWRELLSQKGPAHTGYIFSALFERVALSLRLYDRMARWEPHSFLLLLPMTSQEESSVVARRIEQLIRTFESAERIRTSPRIAVIESHIEYGNASMLITKLQEEIKFHFEDDILLVERKKPRDDKKITPLKIAIVDGDEVNDIILDNTVDREKWDISIWTEDEDPFGFLYRVKPDIILLELRTTYFNGQQLCSQLRKMEEFKDKVIIFTSKSHLERDIVHSFQAGADDYIRKPYFVREMEARLKRHIEVRQQRGYRHADMDTI